MVILLSLVGALLILDKYAIGEFGLSQPLIAGTILGAIFGDIQDGIFLGALVQLIFLSGLPIGRDVPPDGQGAGIAGVGSYLILRQLHAEHDALFGAMILSLSAGIFGGALEILTRRFNEMLYHQFLRKEGSLRIYHLSGILTAFVRGLMLFLPTFLIARFINLPAEIFHCDKELFVLLAVGVGMANGIYLFIKRKTVAYGIIGLLCGLALLVF